MKPKETVINELVILYPEHTDFINEVILTFPSKNDFDERLYDYSEDDEDQDDASSESEVYMLEQEMEHNYPGDDVWVNIFNSLMDSDWDTN